jgi:hypothetical protein
MLRSIGHRISAIVLTAIISSTFVLANPVEKRGIFKSKSSLIKVSNAKRVTTFIKIIHPEDKHSYQLSLQPGQKALVTIQSDRTSSMTVQTPSEKSLKWDEQKVHRKTLASPGDYVIDVESSQPSSYTIEVRIS